MTQFDPSMTCVSWAIREQRAVTRKASPTFAETLASNYSSSYNLRVEHEIFQVNHKCSCWPGSARDPSTRWLTLRSGRCRSLSFLDDTGRDHGIWERIKSWPFFNRGHRLDIFIHKIDGNRSVLSSDLFYQFLLGNWGVNTHEFSLY